MKINMPVTSQEVLFDESQFMLTKTDLKGVITYANKDFIEISGFSEEELLGSSHNIVRHPDMPVEAFKDMWGNLKAGKPWTGLVKNRTKNGDFYWVVANATPIVEHNQVTGYLSARRKPTPEQVLEASKAYALFKEGNAKGLAIVDGKVIRTSFFNKMIGSYKTFELSQLLWVFPITVFGITALQSWLSSANSAQTSGLTAYVLPTIGTLLTLIVTLTIKKSINNPLKRALHAINEISLGKYSGQIDTLCNSETQEVLLALKKMQTLMSVSENALKETAVETKVQSALFENQLAAINRSTGAIEFAMDGKVIFANNNFLNIIGYSLEEAMNKFHRDFVEPEFIQSGAYEAFWQRLINGESISGQFLRIGKNGKNIWLDATYNPIMDANGNPYKVVKYATDVTEQKLKNADHEGQITAIGKSQGVIELGLDGTVLKVNQTYLDMLGYLESELVGQNVSKVLDSEYARSDAYKALWAKLVQGESDIGQYKRIARDGREVWIQASYNAIHDLKGRPYKIVNYTMDITASKLVAADNQGQIAGIHKTQGVIEFDLSGKILTANDLFLELTGYALSEIVGKQHEILVEPSYRVSSEYKYFWDALRRGEAQVGQVKRINKSGDVVWMQAIYNPISDMNGNPFKVVKYATNITEQHNSAQSLASAVEETKLVIENAKQGDLRNRVSLEGKSGDIASLCEGVNALMDKMREIILQVREAGDTINTAADEISSGNNDLSSRTEQQASSLEETAASMEELATTVKQNSDNAKQANQLAAAASSIAIKGGEAVGDVVTTMSAINQSAKKIEDIIAVIDGIAFQTNILALNAAVEAARAGEQGRGFAVVAGEVRNLAQRSATAAKEIKDLISDSVARTTEGTVLVEQAGKTMKQVVDSVQRVTDIMGEIAGASAEQSSGISQVNQAVTSMDEVTQQNAALVEQAAAASESLVEQAEALVQAVSLFKLENDVSNHPKHKKIQSNMPRNLINSKISVAKLPNSPVISKNYKTGTRDGEWEEF